MGSVNIKKTTSVLFFLRIANMLMSLITVTLTAKLYGVSVEKDAWLLVSVFLSSIVLLVWGPINETFRAKFVFIKEKEGEDSALKSASSLVSGIVVVTLFIITLLFIFAKPISKFAAIDLTQAGIDWFLSLLLIMIPSILISELNNISTSILNAYSIFYIPEIVASIASLISIFILIWIAPSIGIYAMALSQYVSVILLMGVLLYAIRKKINIKKDWIFKPNISLIKPYLIYAIPFFLPYAVGQINGFGEQWLAGILGIGNITILNFGRRFTSILQSVLGSVITTVLVPILASSHIVNNSDSFNKSIKEGISILYAIMLIAIPLLAGAAYPLCDFLFHRGNVTSEDINEISLLCRLFAIAFLGVFFYIIFGTVLLSTEKGKNYAFWGVLTQIFVFSLNISLVNYYGLIIFPVSWGLVHLITGLIMWHKGRAWNKSIFWEFLKNNCIVIGVSIIIYFISSYILPVNSFINLSISVFIILVVGFMLLPLLGIKKPLNILKNKLHA